jgi:copper chaperone CopZ
MHGVKSVEANPIAQKTQITFDDTQIKLSDIIGHLRNQRYEVLGEPKYIK